MFPFLQRRNEKYCSVSTEDSISGVRERSPDSVYSKSNNYLASFGVFVVVALAALVGFLIGAHHQNLLTIIPEYSRTIVRAPVSWEDDPVIFTFNRTFSKAPSEDNVEAWNSIIPKGRGAVLNPDISPEMSMVTVFHQIHCLNDIRRQYYILTNESTESFFSSPAHMHHCFEYLRQGLMCSADSGLEPFRPVLPGSEHIGATGWVNERLCRNYGQLMNWAEKWRAEDSTGFD